MMRKEVLNDGTKSEKCGHLRLPLPWKKIDAKEIGF